MFLSSEIPFFFFNLQSQLNDKYLQILPFMWRRVCVELRASSWDFLRFLPNRLEFPQVSQVMEDIHLLSLLMLLIFSRREKQWRRHDIDDAIFPHCQMYIHWLIGRKNLFFLSVTEESGGDDSTSSLSKLLKKRVIMMNICRQTWSQSME